MAWSGRKRNGRCSASHPGKRTLGSRSHSVAQIVSAMQAEPPRLTGSPPKSISCSQRSASPASLPIRLWCHAQRNQAAGPSWRTIGCADRRACTTHLTGQPSWMPSSVAYWPDTAPLGAFSTIPPRGGPPTMLLCSSENWRQCRGRPDSEAYSGAPALAKEQECKGTKKIASATD
jgi:hypothetical protein